MLEKLRENDINIAKVYYCPHIDEDNCNCRKPGLELFYQAIKEFKIDPSTSYAIGDKERDLSICSKLKVKGILLTNDKNNDYICKSSLLEAAKYIADSNRSEKR